MALHLRHGIQHHRAVSTPVPTRATVLTTPLHPLLQQRRAGKVSCNSTVDGNQQATSVAGSTPSTPPREVPSALPSGSLESVDAGSSSSSEGGSSKKRKRQAESTDAVATFLTRRFGIAGGLVWLGVLAVGSIGEQVKTRLEVEAEASGVRDVSEAQREEVALPNGLRYTDLRVGGGQVPPKGYLVVLDYVGKANGVVFEDTKARGKPLVLIFGARPLTGGLCVGVEQALSTMRAGGRRLVTVPPELGFGDAGAVLRPTLHVSDKQGAVPPGATLEYDLELLRVSIPPS